MAIVLAVIAPVLALGIVVKPVVLKELFGDPFRQPIRSNIIIINCLPFSVSFP